MDYNQIKSLINDIGNSNVDEVNLEFPDGIKIVVKKNHAEIKEIIKETSLESSQIPKTENSSIISEKQVKQEMKHDDENCKIIKSPMVGTFYSKSSPDAKEFVKVGDIVKKGQVLCIIEAMKLMNEIECEYDGEILEINVKDDSMVEFDQPLFKLKF